MTARFPISPSDAFHLGVAHDHVGCLWLLDTLPSPGALEAAAARLARVNLRMRVAYSAAEGCWRERPDFDPAGQVVHAATAPDMAAMLAGLAAQYLEPLLYGRPPWRAILLPIAGRGPALCFLAHHAFTDGIRGFQLARAFAGCDSPSDAPSRLRPRPGMAAVIEMVRASLADVSRPRANALTKAPDSGTRAFRIATIPGAVVQAAARRRALGRTDLLASAFAQAIARSTCARTVRLMVPRDVGSGAAAGNAFLPEVREFRVDVGGEVRSDPSRSGFAIRAAADRLRMAIIAHLPAPLAAAGYHRWADSFDALCTVLPNLFGSASIAGSRVVSAFGIPPLIWHQPLSVAMIVGRQETTLFLASDPAAVSSADILAETVRGITALA